MIADFLESSSIHGLVYLSKGKTRLQRLVWLACILASCSTAGWIIYHNFLNWRNSPAIVTSVDSLSVKVTQVFRSDIVL